MKPQNMQKSFLEFRKFDFKNDHAAKALFRELPESVPPEFPPLRKHVVIPLHLSPF